MMRYADDAEPGLCPFIDTNDPRCARRFTLGRIEQAFRVCLQEGHSQCVVHQQLAGQRTHEPITITVAGRPIRRAGVRTAHG